MQDHSSDSPAYPAATLEKVANYMRQHQLKMTTAESCTAGLIAAHLADVKGAGSTLECAVIAYSPEAKMQRLGVKPETIGRFNLTSEQVAAEMAIGALAHSGANLALANTGVTDDTDPAIPAGTQCFAWLFGEGSSAQPSQKLFTETKRFGGDRNSIRNQAAIYALEQIPVKHALSVASGERGDTDQKDQPAHCAQP